MNVGFDGYFIGAGTSAWGSTELDLVRRLPICDSSNQFMVFVTPNGTPLLPELPNVHPVEVPSSTHRNALLRCRAIQRAIRKDGLALDAYIETCEIAPRLTRHIPIVSLEHDFSEGRLEPVLSLGRIRGMLYRRMHLDSIARSREFFCNSEFTLRQLREHLRPDQAATVFPHGCADAYVTSGLGTAATPATPDYLNDDPYLLYVGRVGVPHKRFELLLRACGGLWNEFPRLRLVAVSSEDFTSRQKHLLKASSGRVRRLSGQSLTEMVALYRGAVALVVPSSYEGFGIPIIEAQNVGCPVVLTDIEVFREVAGAGGIFFDGSEADLILKLQSVIRREGVSRSVEAGKINCRRYSWQAAAEILAESLHRLDGTVDAAEKRRGGSAWSL